MFLVKSGVGVLSGGVWGLEGKRAGLVPKLGGDFGELVKESCVDEVRILWSGSCVGLG